MISPRNALLLMMQTSLAPTAFRSATRASSSSSMDTKQWFDDSNAILPSCQIGSNDSFSPAASDLPVTTPSASGLKYFPKPDLMNIFVSFTINALNSSSNDGPSPLACGAERTKLPSSRALTNLWAPNWIAIDPVIWETSLHAHHPPLAIASSSTAIVFGFFSSRSFLSFLCFRFFDLNDWKTKYFITYSRLNLKLISCFETYLSSSPLSLSFPLLCNWYSDILNCFKLLAWKFKRIILSLFSTLLKR